MRNIILKFDGKDAISIMQQIQTEIFVLKHVHRL
jgi:hypothetical protein